MQKLPLDYETPSAAPVPPSPLWMIVRLIIAAPFASWGILMVIRGLGAMFEGRLHYVAQVLWGVLLIAVAVAAIRLPVHRRRA
jgi:hypothetical protein